MRSAATEAGLDPQHVRRLMQLLLNLGEIVKVSDEFFFGREVIDELIGKVRGYADAQSDHSLDVARFKEIAGVSRKYAIPLLEYFDREKITVRRGDVRVIL